MGEPATQGPNETMMDRFKRLEPISSLADDQIQELASQSSIEKIAAGQSVFAEPFDPGQAVYLLSGSIETVTKDGSKVQVITAGEDTALHPIAADQNSVSSAKTRTPAVITRIDKKMLDTLLTWAQIAAPETEVLMSEDGIISINKADWLKTMFKSPTFRDLPASNIEELLMRLEPVRVRAGDVIIRQGDQGDYFYMIDKGVAMVTRNPDDDEDSVEMAELNEGATFGEAALISDKPRNATVSMMDDGILLRLSKDDFNKLLKQPNLQQRDFEQARQLVEQGEARWVDVRLMSEFAHGHLPGAINIQMRDMHRLAQELDTEHEYICYCDTGNRSSAATFVLHQYGLRASVLTGGIQNVASEFLEA